MELGADGTSNRQPSRISCGSNGAVTEITRQQIYRWRHELKGKGLWSPDAGALFFPLDIPVAAGLPAPTPPPTSVELRLRGGHGLHFDSTLDPTVLTALIRAVEAA